MKKLSFISLIVACVLLVASVFFASPMAKAAELLKYYSSDQIFKAFGKEKIEAFMKATGIQVLVKNASSGSCLYALMNGNCDVASTARALYHRHVDYGYYQTPICLDPLAVIVNAGCEVDSLTEDQLQDIFSGDISNWREVGGPDLPIIIVVPAMDSAAHKNFRRQVMKHKEMEHDFMAYDSTMVTEVVKHFPCGTVSFISRGAATHDKDIKTIKIDGQLPTDKDYPYFQIFYYVTKGEPTGSVKKFIDFDFSEEGKKIIQKYGMVPAEK